MTLGWMNENFDFNEDAIMADVARYKNLNKSKNSVHYFWGNPKIIRLL